MKSSFWNKKRVFITGHTGFKGSWLTLWLKNLNANICGYSLKPKSKKSLFYEANVSDGIHSHFENILNYKELSKKIRQFKPEIVFHLAAQSLVKESFYDPQKTFSTNISGTINLLESLRNCKSVKSIIIVTTDKVYENKESKLGYKESDLLGGYDPYSSSKACCEIITNSYRSSFFNEKGMNVGIATARAGNVIGGGDYSDYRLIPDIFKSIDEKKILKIRNKSSIRPWQHVLEALNGYLKLAESLFYDCNRYSEAWNFGPNFNDCKKVDWVLKEFSKEFDFTVKDISKDENIHETGLLKLDISKSKKKTRMETYFISK